MRNEQYKQFKFRSKRLLLAISFNLASFFFSSNAAAKQKTRFEFLVQVDTERVTAHLSRSQSSSSLDHLIHLRVSYTEEGPEEQRAAKTHEDNAVFPPHR